MSDAASLDVRFRQKLYCKCKRSGTRQALGTGGNVYNVVKSGGVYEVEGPGILASFIAIPHQDLYESSGEVHGFPFSGFVGRTHYSFLVLTPFPELFHGEYLGGLKVPYDLLAEFAKKCRGIL